MTSPTNHPNTHFCVFMYPGCHSIAVHGFLSLSSLSRQHCGAVLRSVNTAWTPRFTTHTRVRHDMSNDGRNPLIPCGFGVAPNCFRWTDSGFTSHQTHFSGILDKMITYSQPICHHCLDHLITEDMRPK